MAKCCLFTPKRPRSLYFDSLTCDLLWHVTLASRKSISSSSVHPHSHHLFTSTKTHAHILSFSSSSSSSTCTQWEEREREMGQEKKKKEYQWRLNNRPSFVPSVLLWRDATSLFLSRITMNRNSRRRTRRWKGHSISKLSISPHLSASVVTKFTS